MVARWSTCNAYTIDIALVYAYASILKCIWTYNLNDSSTYFAILMTDKECLGRTTSTTWNWSSTSSKLASIVLPPGRWTPLWIISHVEVGNSIPYPFSTLWQYMLPLNRYWYTLPLTFCKAMSRCSIDGQLSRSFSHGIIGERNIFVAAPCIDSIVAKTRRKATMIVEVVVYTYVLCANRSKFCNLKARQIIAFYWKGPGTKLHNE